MSDRRYVSPDGQLRFVVMECEEDGLLLLGFDDYPWHTHDDLLVPEYGATRAAAAENFVNMLLGDALVIAIDKVAGAVQNIYVTDDPAEELRYAPEGATVEFRLWSGSPVTLDDAHG